MSFCSSCGAQNPRGAKFCSECGTPIGTAPAVASEERKLVTVLFADVVGSTSLGDRFDAELLKELMSRFFAAMRVEIEAEGGTVEKYIGDAVMAAFGVPVAHEDDPLRALRAALRMRRRLESLNAELRSEHGVDLSMRIGVNTGEVLAATAPRPGEAMATGDVVNVASRLQHLAAPGGVVVGERTAAAVRGFDLAPLGEHLELRGKADGMVAFELLGELQEPSRGIPGVRTPLVGRDRELDLLRSLLRRVEDERLAHLVTIYGEPGVGKSRMVAEFTASVDARVVWGRCPAYGEGVTFWPLVEIAKTELGILETDPPDVALAKVRALAAAPELESAIPAIAYTIGLDDAGSPLAGMPPSTVSIEIHRAWLAFFAWMARSGPLIVVVDDIHWADTAMLDLLEELPDRIPAPVMFLCPSRTELTARRPGWAGGKRRFSSLPLDPLDAQDADHLMRLLLDLDQLQPDLRARILERAEGNPFFLEEIVRRLMDADVIVHQNGGWKATAEIATVDIPDTVQGVLAARIDLLPPDVKRAAQFAAVVGRVFWPGAVASLLDSDALRVEELIDELERRDLVVGSLTSVMEGQRELMFKHILTRDVAYDSLPRRSRPDAHRRLAEWIEQTYRDRRLEVAELLALHFDLGGNRTKAYAYSFEAARRDLGRLSLDQAASFAARAAELADSPGDRAAALSVQGEAHYQLANGDRAYPCWREAVEILERTPGADQALLATVCGRLGMMLTRASGLMPNTRVPEAEARRYVDVGFRAVAETETETMINLLVAEGGWKFGYPDPPATDADLDRMSAAAGRAIELAEQLGRADLVSLGLDVLHISQQLRDGVAEMVIGVERRQELADQVHAILDLDDIFYMSSLVYCEQGRYADALASAEEGIVRVAALGGEGMGSICNAALCRHLLGDWQAAIDCAATVFERYGSQTPGFLRTMTSVAEYALCAQGRSSEAAPLRELMLRTENRVAFRALAMLAEGVPPDGLLEILDTGGVAGDGVSFERIARGEVLRAARRWDQLAEQCVVIRERTARIDWRVGSAVADRFEGAIALESGNVALATELFRSSVAGYAACDAPWESAVSALDLAEALSAAGNRTEADAVLDRATPALTRAGALNELRRLAEARE